ncbi:MAG: AraC family transcriptional regulator [Geminicoccaceae bacterium]
MPASRQLDCAEPVQGLACYRLCHAPVRELALPASAPLMVNVALSGATCLQTRFDHGTREVLHAPGTVVFTKPMAAGVWRWDEIEVAHLALDAREFERRYSERFGSRPDFDQLSLLVAPSPLLTKVARRLLGPVKERQHDLLDEVTAEIGRIAGERFRAPERCFPLPAWALRRVMAMMLEDLSRPLRICDLADAAGLSVVQFARVFRQSTGVSPHQWRLQARLAEVKRLLATTADNLIEIACHTGFSSHAHLTGAFSQAVGMSPSVWRRAEAARRS